MSCTGAIPTLGYPSRYEAAEALRAEGLTPEQIAEQIGTTTGAVYQLLAYAKRGRANAPRIRVSVPTRVLEHFQEPAAMRGVAPATIARRILATVAREGLADAILDDRGRRS